jgi:hypothetical protein
MTDSDGEIEGWQFGISVEHLDPGYPRQTILAIRIRATKSRPIVSLYSR